MLPAVGEGRASSPVHSSLVWIVPALVAMLAGMYMLFGERWDSDAPFYHAIALKAAREGHWWVLMQGELPYFNKPPLGFWMHAVFIQLFGEHDWSSALPELLVFAGCCGLIASTAAKFHGKRVGLIAGCVFALCFEWISRIANFRLDFLHTLCLLGAVRCVAGTFDFSETPRGMPLGVGEHRKALALTLGAGVCMGLALMTKPIFALLLIPMLGVWLIWSGQKIKSILAQLLVISGVALVIALPWHLSMIARYGNEFISWYWTQQSYKRLTGELFNPEPWWWYAKYMFARTDGTSPVSLWPMLIATLLAIGIFWQRRRSGTWQIVAGDRLAIVWTLGWAALLSAFPSKHNYYFLIVYPGFAWLAAIGVTRFFLLDRVRVSFRLAWLGATGLVIALMIAPSQLAPAERQKYRLDPDLAKAAASIKDHGYSEIWNGSLHYWDASMFYIKAERWPRSSVVKNPAPMGEIPEEAVAVFDTNREPRLLPKDRVLGSFGRFAIVERP